MKKAIRLSIDGSSSDVQDSTAKIRSVISDIPSTVPASVRIAEYEPDNPEVLKMELGKMTRWLAGDELKNGNPVGEPDDAAVADEKFSSQLKRALLPALKSLAGEVMWGPGGKKEWQKRNSVEETTSSAPSS